ncbi:dethiobiotin synthase [Wenzhouxiangella sp. XN24]|uniref:dethiobiotin synthase n=1 Tax=Wenzhouxiangella sp. XN24 TaxID=2713569 RepID=UPI0013EA60CE|nr:dethiobiotin synthase [Wenzhouxiangella sp. XN24]NGX17466.1 dethiobiotin synthase [Wenzhouxiangella sp. XN24]
MRGVFVTGTDTEVGKTLFCAALLVQLAAAGVAAAACKPVSAGCRREQGRLVNDDAELLARLAPLSRPLEIVNPVALEPAIAPHIAAAEAGLRLEAGALVSACRSAADDAAFLVVEGAGGWRVPLTGEDTLADVARGLGLPIVLVVGLRLGCLNHALLTAEAVRADGLELAGWVANPLASAMPRMEENIATLTARLGPPLARLPHCPDAAPEAQARAAAAALPAGLWRHLAGGRGT